MSEDNEETIPRKGAPAVPVSQAGDQMLHDFVAWWDAQGERTQERWASNCRAARAELEKRRAPTPANPNAIVTTETTEPRPADLARVREPDAITKRLTEMAERFHLVAPATEIDHVPEGFGVSVSMVQISGDNFVQNGRYTNVNKRGPGDVYDVGGGKVGLSKRPLEQIWAAAGGSWNLALTGRLDDGSDPRYVHFRAVGVARNFDGTPREVSGEVEIDARDGSDLINEIETKAREREANENHRGKKDGGASQILELRKFLLRHAESKAKLRAIASLGVKRSYYASELDKPFAVARLTFTGQTDDPELRREFSRMAAASALGGAQSLFGPGAPSPAALPAAPAGHPPPPVGSVDDDDEPLPEFGNGDEVVDGEELPT